MNGGECLSDLSKFTTSCSCSEGYEGDTCQNRGKVKHKNTINTNNFVGDFVFLCCMSFIRSHLPGGEQSPTELLV